jgi:hypothetical protein
MTGQVAAGVEARIKVWPGLPHVAPLFTIMPEAHQALREIAAFVASHMEPRARAPVVEGNPAVALGARSVMQQAGNAS